MNPTKAGRHPQRRRPLFTDSTKISLTRATATVTNEERSDREVDGHASPASPSSSPANSSLCVFSENSRLNPYATMSRIARAALKFVPSLAPRQMSPGDRGRGKERNRRHQQQCRCIRPPARLYS